MEELNLLIIPDPHTRKGEDNISRFTALGRKVVSEQPDVIINMGDHFDFPSLSAWDEGTEAMWGQFLDEDIAAGHEALDAFHAEIDAYNKGRRNKYTPRLEFLEGNHEWRMERFLIKNPKFRGTFGFEKLGLEERGWNTTRYKKRLVIQDIVFMHHFENKMGKPLASLHLGYNIIRNHKVSGIMGHNHGYNLYKEGGADGRKYLAGTVGWYGSSSQIEAYAESTMYNWFNGITEIKNAKEGFGDDSFTSQETLLKEYL